jgi:hypothetical protein
MKNSLIAAQVLALGVLTLSGQAFAACNGNSLNQAQLEAQIVGNTVCATRGNDRWQEYHAGNGDLIDFKLGANHPVDPSKKVGTWSIAGTGGNTLMRYNYGSGGTYDYEVFSNGGGSYSFCSGGELAVTVIGGQSACP